jgi:hypothetical protein
LQLEDTIFHLTFFCWIVSTKMILLYALCTSETSLPSTSLWGMILWHYFDTKLTQEQFCNLFRNSMLCKYCVEKLCHDIIAPIQCETYRSNERNKRKKKLFMVQNLSPMYTIDLATIVVVVLYYYLFVVNSLKNVYNHIKFVKCLWKIAMISNMFHTCAKIRRHK